MSCPAVRPEQLWPCPQLPQPPTADDGHAAASTTHPAPTPASRRAPRPPTNRAPRRPPPRCTARSAPHRPPTAPTLPTLACPGALLRVPGRDRRWCRSRWSCPTRPLPTVRTRDDGPSRLVWWRSPPAHRARCPMPALRQHTSATSYRYSCLSSATLPRIRAMLELVPPVISWRPRPQM